jgi:tagatose-1,6-bisphosphate aldolase
MSEEEIRANLRQMNEYTRGRLLMMLSGGDAKTLIRKAQLASEELNFVGNFAGRGIWQKSFTSVASNAQAKEQVKQEITIRLSLEHIISRWGGQRKP